MDPKMSWKREHSYAMIAAQMQWGRVAMDNLIQVPLNLPDVRVLSTQRTEQGHWLIHVESRLEGTQCRRCGREIRDLHGVDAAVRLRHLPLFDVPVLLEIRPKRYRCPSCAGNPTTTQRCEWYELRSPNTKAYEQWALRMLINSTVADAARKLGVSAETIDGLLDRWIERAVDWDAWERLGVIGLDEIALTRGHRDFVALVTVPLEEGGVEIVAVLADRKKQTVAAFLRAIPETLRHTIERTCTDMYEGFVNAITEEIPWAEIVIDRFHVARAYRDCADTVRKKELKRLKRALPKAEYAEITGAMWPFRKQPGALKPEERDTARAGLQVLAEDRGRLPPAGRPDGPVRTRLHKGGSQACDPGLVQAGAGEWAGRVRELSGDARSVDG